MNEIHTDDLSQHSTDDDFTPSDPAFLALGHLRRPDGSTVVPVELDAKTARWLEEHHVNYQLFLSNVLKAYVESQHK